MILSTTDIRYHHLMTEPLRVATHGPAFSGYVLAGGRSTRMGRDKALLPFGRATLLDHVAQCVHQSAGNVTVIGPPERYAAFGYPVVADHVENSGPLGGLFTALSITPSDWNLIVACDMPGLTAHFLDSLLHAAESSPADCLVPSKTGRAELDPLCAVYHRRCLSAAKAALDRNLLKMQDFVSSLHLSIWPVPNSGLLENVNTPEEWAATETNR
jgi:molybdopterin-guanine dinucleotide biosynthesis protein A